MISFGIFREDEPWVHNDRKGERLIIINAILSTGWVNGAKASFSSQKENRGSSRSNECQPVSKMAAWQPIPNIFD